MITAKLHNAEITFYILVWLTSIFYSSYHVYLAGKLFDNTYIGDDFQIGLFGWKKDVADYEWSTWLPFILYVIPPWIAIHLFLTELTRWISPQGVPAIHCCITLCFISLNFGLASAMFSVFEVLVYYIILRMKSVILIWLFGVPFLLLSCFGLQEMWEKVGGDDQAFTMVVVGTTWLHLHCTSFSLEMLSDSPSEIQKPKALYNLLGYCFYFPTYFLGPFIIYSSFSRHVYRPFKGWTKARVVTFLLNLLRYLFWAAFTEGCLYFLYIHALQYHLSTVISLGDWTFYGLGFLLGQFFCMKYVAVYGILGTIARFDGYPAPPPPRCVARVHLYTDMWRYFDVGFYQFMHKYIYSPLCAGSKKLSRRLLSSLVCFTFVFLWHGVHLSIFIWTLLNFIGVSLVSFAISTSRSASYQYLEKRLISAANRRRLEALLAAPLFVMGPVSSFFFFSGITTGQTYMHHLFISGSWQGGLGLLFVAYAMCQVSIETKIRQEEDPRNKLKST